MEKRGQNRSFSLYNFPPENRRGLSTVLLTLVIILLSLVAIAIIWITIRSLVRENSELVEIQNKFFKERIDIMSVKSSDPFLNITIKKPSGDMKSSSINVSGVITSQVAVDIVSVVDLSGSMMECYGIDRTYCTALGGSYSSSSCSSLNISQQSGCLSYGGTWGDKITPLQDANKNMINTLLSGNNRIGLTAYRNNIIGSASASLTNDMSALNSAINLWAADSTTCICCGINNASDKLSQSNDDEPKAIIVMSDGEANVQCSRQGTGDAKTDAIEAACDANSTLDNIAIWSVGVGDADVDTLQQIANCGGGSYFSVENASELIEIYQEIAQEIEIRYQKVQYLTYFSIVFHNSTDSYKDMITDIPDTLETKTYNFNLEGRLSGKIIKIEIYPVMSTSARKETIGPLLDSWTAK